MKRAGVGGEVKSCKNKIQGKEGSGGGTKGSYKE